MKENHHTAEKTIHLHNNNHKNYPITIINEKEKQNNRVKKLSYSKNNYSNKKNNKKAVGLFPIIHKKERNKNYYWKNVKEDTHTESSICSKKNDTLELKTKNIFKNKKNMTLNNIITKKPLTIENDSYTENYNNNNLINIKNGIYTNEVYNTTTIHSYFSKSMYACKNKKRKKKPQESLDDVFKQLLDIKYKIRDINNKKRSKILKFNSNLSAEKNNSPFSTKINFKLCPNNIICNTCNNNSNNNISYNFKTTIFNSKPKSTRNKQQLRKAKSVKPNIDIINFRKCATSYRRFNEHIKYILHIRENEIHSLANQFQKALDENEKEKEIHYKNRVFPLEIIQKIIKNKEELILNKYRNEYLKRIDRYDVHLLSKFMDNEKKHAKKNNAKIFKGIVSKLMHIK